MNMEKYFDAAEAALSDKKNDKLNYFINIILKKSPELKSKIDELCNKYKVKL